MNLRSELIDSIHFSYRDERYPKLTRQEMERYVQSASFLEDTLLLSRTGILIIEYKTWTYQYCSANATDIVGYTAEEILEKGPALLLALIHLEDLKLQRIIHPMMNDYFRSIPPQDKARYRFCFTSRATRPDGKEIMILQNNIFIKWDEQGKPVAKLILLTDISDYKQDNHIVFYSTRIGDDGMNSVEMQRTFTPRHDIRISPRELELLKLVNKGYRSRDIALHFGISEETVKNTRKRVMQKLGCRNQAQMVKLASLYGMLQTG